MTKKKKELSPKYARYRNRALEQKAEKYKNNAAWRARVKKINNAAWKKKYAASPDFRVARLAYSKKYYQKNRLAILAKHKARYEGAPRVA